MRNAQKFSHFVSLQKPFNSENVNMVLQRQQVWQFALFQTDKFIHQTPINSFLGHFYEYIVRDRIDAVEKKMFAFLRGPNATEKKKITGFINSMS